MSGGREMLSRGMNSALFFPQKEACDEFGENYGCRQGTVGSTVQGRSPRCGDHRHPFEKRQPVPYAFSSPEELLEHFFAEADEVLKELKNQ